MTENEPSAHPVPPNTETRPTAPLRERQRAWDTMLAASFWPCFSSVRRRKAWHLIKSFELIFGECAGEGISRFPIDAHQRNQDISRFVCSYMQKLADRLIDAGAINLLEVESIVSWLQSSGIDCRRSRAEAIEHRETFRSRQQYRADQIGIAGLLDFKECGTKPGGRHVHRIRAIRK